MSVGLVFRSPLYRYTHRWRCLDNPFDQTCVATYATIRSVTMKAKLNAHRKCYNVAQREGEKISEGEIAFHMLAANGEWPLPANVLCGYRPPLLPSLFLSPKVTLV